MTQGFILVMLATDPLLALPLVIMELLFLLMSLFLEEPLFKKVDLNAFH
jgi:hypothetical protein